MESYYPKIGDWFTALLLDGSFSPVMQCIELDSGDVKAYSNGFLRYYFNGNNTKQYFKVK